MSGADHLWASQFSADAALTSGFADQLSVERDIVYDLRCPDLDDDPCYYIMKIEPAKHQRFLSALESKTRFNMSDFGELLHFGRGEPDDALKAELRARFGMYKLDA